VAPVGTIRLYLTSVGVNETGQVVASGLSTDRMASKHPFLAYLRPDGSSFQYISTGQYLVTEMSVASDGSIWTVGAQQADSVSADARSWTNYDMFRHYSASGQLLEHFLPHWGGTVKSIEWHSTGDPTVRYVAVYKDKDNQPIPYRPDSSLGVLADSFAVSSNSTHPLRRHAFLDATGDTVVLYNTATDTLWTYNLQSRQLTTWHIASPGQSSAHVSGFCRSQTGELVVGFRGNTTQTGVKMLRLDASHHSAVWLPIDNGRGTFIGCDSGGLVFAENDHVKATNYMLVWSRIDR
jgi:hypothetical protein